MRPEIKIFVACHKPCVLPQDRLFVPVQGGAAIAEKRLDMSGDDTGDNISAKNKRYCEMTVQYWAWKNVKADYVGLMHYRRFLCFAPNVINGDETQCPKADEKAFETFGLDEESMRAVIEPNDVIIPAAHFSPLNNKWQYAKSRVQHLRDLKFCMNEVVTRHPEMHDLVKRYMHMHRNYYCNMFVMKKDIFDEYCEWLFPILEAHEKQCDCSGYNEQEMRVSGFLAERLCAIYLLHMKERQKFKIKELPKVIFLNTDP